MAHRVTYIYFFFMGAGFLTLGAMEVYWFGLLKTFPNQQKSTSMLVMTGELPSLKKANAWLNSAPLTTAELKGKVVLVQFGTYTCINWLRTLPYIRAWQQKYRDKGLVVIIVHTPEFTFEKNLDNVRHALNSMNIDFPIAVDNDYEIWKAFDNHYWPALYFIDAKGRIQHQQFGEGEYDQSERVIQRLLTKAGAKNISMELISAEARGIEVQADWNNLNSQENYLGYMRTQNFASNAGRFDENHIYTLPSKLRLNEWAVSGEWTVTSGSIISNAANGKITYRFHARDIHLVMGPASPGDTIKFRVLIDGNPPGAAHGLDIDKQGRGIIKVQRLYQLIRQPMPIVQREIMIEFEDPGAEAFSFTFG